MLPRIPLPPDPPTESPHPDPQSRGEDRDPVVSLVCLLTFLHFTAEKMRGPVLPLYAAAHGATATGVGLIVGAHMVIAAAGSILLGHAADVWGRRSLLLGGMAVRPSLVAASASPSPWWPA